MSTWFLSSCLLTLCWVVFIFFPTRGLSTFKIWPVRPFNHRWLSKKKKFILSKSIWFSFNPSNLLFNIITLSFNHYKGNISVDIVLEKQQIYVMFLYLATSLIIHSRSAIPKSCVTCTFIMEKISRRPKVQTWKQIKSLKAAILNVDIFVDWDECLTRSISPTQLLSIQRKMKIFFSFTEFILFYKKINLKQTLAPSQLQRKRMFQPLTTLKPSFSKQVNCCISWNMGRRAFTLVTETSVLGCQKLYQVNLLDEELFFFHDPKMLLDEYLVKKNNFWMLRSTKLIIRY